MKLEQSTLELEKAVADMTDKRDLQKGSQMLIYQFEDGQTRIEVQLEAESVWLTQKQMAELFRTTVPNINLHLKNIFEEGELDDRATIKNFLIVQNEGNRQVKRTQKLYSLDAIISVGYRIKSHVATRFRIWAYPAFKGIHHQGLCAG